MSRKNNVDHGWHQRSKRAHNSTAEEYYKEVAKRPGLRPSQYEVNLGLNRGHSQSLLCALENMRLLLYEDDDGKLYPFYADEI